MVSTGKPVTAGHGPAVTGSDPHRHLTPLEGWRDFIHAAPAPPALVPAATPRMLAMEFARFLGLPVLPRANMTDIIEAVCGVAVDMRVSAVLVDEIHNMQLATRSGAEVSDTLKYFSERLPATFVYAGIDLEHQGLFTGIRGRQIAGRFTLIPAVAFPLSGEWQSLIVTLEKALRLHQHQPGTLAMLDKYLHQRTGGMLGSPA